MPVGLIYVHFVVLRVYIRIKVILHVHLSFSLHSNLNDKRVLSYHGYSLRKKILLDMQIKFIVILNFIGLLSVYKTSSPLWYVFLGHCPRWYASRLFIVVLSLDLHLYP